MLLDNQRKVRQTAVDTEQSTMSEGNITTERPKVELQRQEQKLARSKDCEQALGGRRQSPEIPCIYTSALQENAKSPVCPVFLFIVCMPR